MGKTLGSRQFQGTLSKFLMSCIGHTGLQCQISTATQTLSMCMTVQYYAFIDMDTKLQICSFIRPSCDVLTLRMPNIQRQPNSCDCGVFSIAVATELALGRDPHLCYWDTTQMRSHLIKCLEQGKMESFPQKKCRHIPPGNRYKKTMPIKN